MQASVECTAEPVTVRHIGNIWDADSTRRTVAAQPGRSVRDYYDGSLGNNPRRVTAVVDGVDVFQVSEDKAARSMRPGSEVIFYRIPGEGFSLSTLVVGLIISAAFAGISYGIAQANRPKRPRFDDSPVYGFGGIGNTVNPGTRIPIVYGEHRVGGHIIESFQAAPRAAPFLADFDGSAMALHTLIGLCDGGRYGIESVDSVEINGNPLSDFKSVTTEIRLGSLHQSIIPGFEISTVQSLKIVDLTNLGGPQTFTTTGEVDRVEVLFEMSQGIYRISAGGSFRHHEIQVQLEHREVGAVSWIDDGTFDLAQRTRNPFKWHITTPTLERGVYEIRLTRVTGDDAGTAVSPITVFALTEILEEGFTYPGIALLAVKQLPSNQAASQVPIYTSRVRGRKVPVYTDETTFTPQWSNNAAWCLLDYLSEPNFSAGGLLRADQLPIQRYIDAAEFCTERGYELDIVLDGSLTVGETIRQIAATARCFQFNGGDQVYIRPDQDEAPVQSFWMSRISRNSFGVLKPRQQSTPNTFVGKYLDRDLNYEENPLNEHDPNQELGAATIPEDLILYGVTRKTQAEELLAYIVNSRRFEKRFIEMEVLAESIAVTAGSIVQVAHDVPGWGIGSGKIRGVGGSGTDIAIDRTITLEVGKTYEITVAFDDDTFETVVVGTPAPFTGSRITVAASWARVPVVGDDYTIGPVGQSKVLYRVLSITRGDRPWRRRIRAREHNPLKYNATISQEPVQSVSTLPNPLAVPANVTGLRIFERQAYDLDGTLRSFIDCNYAMPSVAGIKALIYFREKGLTPPAGWLLAGESRTGYFAISEKIEVPGVEYEVSVVTVSQFGIAKHPSDGEIASLVTAGSTRQPSNVTGFRVDRTVEGLVFAWTAIDPATNFDLDLYEIRQGTSWSIATPVATTRDTTVTAPGLVKSVDGASTSFMIKARNTAGNYSATADIVTFLVDPRFNENVILTQAEDPSWIGTKTNCTVVGNDLEFTVSGDYLTPKFQVTSGSAVRAIISAFLDAIIGDTNLTWDNPDVGGQDWESTFATTTTWEPDLEGDDRVSVKLEMRISQLTSADGDFGPWKERRASFVEDVKWAQARYTVTILDESIKVSLKKFRMLFDVPDVFDSGQETTSASSTISVSFNRTYQNAPRINATIINPTAGDEIDVSSPTSSGFTLAVRNAGALVSRTVDWQSVGF